MFVGQQRTLKARMSRIAVKGSQGVRRKGISVVDISERSLPSVLQCGGTGGRDLRVSSCLHHQTICVALEKSLNCGPARCGPCSFLFYKIRRRFMF